MVEEISSASGRSTRVLLATAFEYPHAGGLSTHMAILADALEKAGHRVELASVSSYPRWFYWLLVKAPSFLINRVARGWGLVWSHEIRKLLIFALLVVRRAHRRYDLVNAQDAFAVNAVAKYDPLQRLPVVLTIHGLFRYEFLSIGSLREGTWPERYFTGQEGKALDRADRIVAVESGRRDHVLSRGVPAEKVSVISNFIEPNAYARTWPKEKLLEDWGIEDEPYIILCPCRLARVKGVDNALKAMPEILRALPNALLLFAGDGELRGELEKESAGLGLRKNVRFLGSVAHGKMSQLYYLSDLVVIPSISDERAEEGVSVAALEVMASGKPLITTPVGGFKQLIVHGETGYFVAEQDPVALAKGILELAADRELTGKLGEQGRAYARENHDAGTAARLFSALYEEAIKSAGG
ncbi:MAG: glycosyltransferase family 4 protein [Actinobacteria bacterium]|nr:glycosyltransferase family 4 protein [Actinomycetota bacterium]